MGASRIFFFNRFFWPDQSATAQILTDLCRELETKGYRIAVVTSRLDYANKQIQYPGREKMGNVEVIRLWSTRFGRGSIAGRLLDYLTIYLSFFFFILRRLEPEDIAVLKTDPPLLSILGAVAKSLRQVRIVSWCQDVFPEVAMAEIGPAAGMGWILGLLRWLRDWSLQASDRVVVLGRDMRDYLAARPVDSGRLAVIPNWSIQEDRGARDETQLRREWNIPGHCLVVGYSGNLGRAHDWQTLLGAAELLGDQPDLLFLCCGGGHGYQQLEKAVEERGLSGRFRFLPYQPRELLSASLRVPDLHWLTLKKRLTQFIFPSKFYGILQAGRPLLFVGDSRSELADIIDGARIGGSVSEGDSEGMAALIRQFAADRRELQAAGERARATWERGFQKATEVAKWDRMLQKLQTVTL